MARLFSETYGQVTEFIKALAAAGLSAEQMKSLTKNPRRMRDWVQWLGETPQPNSGTHLKVERVFRHDSSLSNILKRNYIETLGELADCTVDEVNEIERIGDTRFQAIQEALKSHGLQFSEDIDNGARRVRYGKYYSCRRDQLEDKEISGLIQLTQSNYKTDASRSRHLTINEIQAMDDSVLAEHFTPATVQRVREWITTNVY